MTYEPRTIALGAEIVHPPIELKSQLVQNIHNSLFQRPEISYQNFQVANDGIHLSNPPQTPGGVSSVSFLPDRIVLREEFRPCTVEDFAQRVVNITSLSYRALSIEVSLGQQFWTRSLVNTRRVHDSRAFVAESMLVGGQKSLESFGRPIHTVGLRYTFPQTGGHAQIFNLRIEPWPQDPRSLWLEVVGQFAHQTKTDNLTELGNYLYATYQFLTGPTFDYLAHFDQERPSTQ